MYTEANVIDGRFTYQSSARKARHTAVHVQYVSPDNGWQPQIEYVADDEAIARYGLNILEVSAFGCTSRGQAHRTGKWILRLNVSNVNPYPSRLAVMGLSTFRVTSSKLPTVGIQGSALVAASRR
ncbi:phage tail protein [Plesiomonas shigelloides]|nr:phage tail protein [Plesiomonas shigelloides]